MVNKDVLKKKRIASTTFIIDNGPIDFRVSVSNEIPIEINKFPVKTKCDFSRVKNRSSYYYKMWNFDLTEITTITDDMEEISYEYEIELNKQINTIHDDKYLSESILLKILDAVKICGKIDENCKIKIKNN